MTLRSRLDPPVDARSSQVTGRAVRDRKWLAHKASSQSTAAGQAAERSASGRRRSAGSVSDSGGFNAFGS